jgi:hypothetical protein
MVGIWVSNPMTLAAVVELDCVLLNREGLGLLFVRGIGGRKHPSVMLVFATLQEGFG